MLKDAGFKLPPKLAALSFASTLFFIGVLTVVVAISILAIGGLVLIDGSTTVITSGVNGQPLVCLGAQVGT